MKAFFWKSVPKVTTDNLRLAVLAVLGNKCARCGFSDSRALQVDHPSGGGTQHRKKLHWSKFYREVLYNPDAYQLLCANCNWIKRYENRELDRK
jgi:hypothetical protein